MTLLEAGERSGGVEARPQIVHLAERLARDPDLVGGKAANLARAREVGHPVLPGFVLTTEGVTKWRDPDTRSQVRTAWARLAADDTTPLVVRSSSTIEDAHQSSNAGRFTSVVHVVGWSAFVDAVDEVIASAGAVALDAPMAVLVQPWLDARSGGVAFGRDPVTGADDIVVSAVVGGPEALVGGQAQGRTVRMSRHGRVRRSGDHRTATAGDESVPELPRHTRHELARLVRSVERTFEGPQDIEWALDGAGHLWLLQSRPITALGAVAGGPVFGPGPIAETFPEQLAPLEEDLWLAPLREGIAEALVLSGTRRRSEVERSPVVVSVDGRPAVDLQLIGAAAPVRRWWRALDPRPGVRRLLAAWRVGRLRAALPALATELIHDVDGALLDVPRLSALSDDQLVRVLRNAQPTLRALHGHEILIGMLMPSQTMPSRTMPTAAAAALARLRRDRANGLTDAQIVEQDPLTLSLVPPRVGPPLSLPVVDTPSPLVDDHEARVDDQSLREALRLRVRWVHELTARAAWEFARRHDSGPLRSPECVRHLRLVELERLARGGPQPSALRDRLLAPGAPLPAAFRLRDDGGVVAVDSESVAVGAGGGRVAGIVHKGDHPPVGAVLVVDNLSPRLASLLPDISGLVAETGSPLSHVAILARELGIATVVAYPHASTEFEDGEHVIVDGTTGEVSRVAARDGETRTTTEGSPT